MEFTLSDELAQLQLGLRALGNDATHCIIRTQGTEVAFLVCSPEATYRCALAADVVTEGGCVVHPQALAALVRNLAVGDVPRFELRHDMWLRIEGYFGRVEIRTVHDIPASERLMTTVSTSVHIDLSGCVALSNFASREPSAGVLCGVHFTETSALATDSYRSARVRLGARVAEPFTVPSRVFSLLCQVEQPISVGLKGHRLLCSNSTVSIDASVIEGQYPSASLLGITEGPHLATVNRRDLQRLADHLNSYDARVATLHRHSGQVDVSFHDERVQLSLPIPATGGSDWEVEVGLRYLRDAIAFGRSETIGIEFIKEAKSLQIVDETSLLQIMMRRS